MLLHVYRFSISRRMALTMDRSYKLTRKERNNCAIIKAAESKYSHYAISRLESTNPLTSNSSPDPAGLTVLMSFM